MAYLWFLRPACCCPTRSGAFKRTNIPNQYIHVACARFQPTLDTTQDPIVFDPSLARKQPCALCGSDYGIVAACHETGCTKVMHVTCALNASLMTKSTKRTEIYCQAHRDSSILNKVIRAAGSSRGSSNGNHTSSTTKRSLGKSLFPSRSTKRAKFYGESSDSNENSDDYSEAEHEEDEGNEEEEEELERGGNSNTTTRRSPSSGASSRNGAQSNASANNSSGSRKLKRPGISRQKSRRSESDSDAAVEGEDDDDDGAALGSSSSSSSHSVSPQRKHQARAENPENSTRQRLLQQLAQRKKSGSGGSSTSTGPSSSSFGTGPGGLAAMNIRTLGNAGPPPPSSTALGGAKPSSTQYTNNSQGSPLLGSTDRFPANDNKRPAAIPPSLGGYSNPSSPIQPRFQQHERSSPKMGAMPTFPPSTSSTPSAPGYTKQNSSTGNAFPGTAEQSNGYHPHPSHHQHHQHHHHHHHHLHHPSHTRPSTHDVTSAPSSADEAAKNALLRQNLIQIFSFLQIAIPAPSSSSSTTGMGANSAQQNGASGVAGQSGAMLEFQPDRLDSYVQALRDSLLGPSSDETKGKQHTLQPPSSSSKPVEVALDAKKRNMIIDRVIREVGL
ncbi:hypothetical protein BGW42_004471 [Actinomortierella wolfii]|nr:hypothetical protein BGW42_004471 [Actinomortierella wolfii]